MRIKQVGLRTGEVRARAHDGRQPPFPLPASIGKPGMQESFQPRRIASRSDRQPRLVGAAIDVWLRVPDLRPHEDPGQPPAKKSSTLGGTASTAKKFIKKRWRPNNLAGWRLPPGLILGGSVTVIAIAIMMLRTGSEPLETNVPTANDWTTAGDWEDQNNWSPPSETSAVAGEDSFAPDGSPPQQPEVAAPAPWPQRGSSPQQATSLPPLPTSTDRPYEPRMATQPPAAREAAEPPAAPEAEFEGTIERLPYRAQHDNHRPKLH